jgi:hypothetical protein
MNGGRESNLTYFCNEFVIFPFYYLLHCYTREYIISQMGKKLRGNKNENDRYLEM